MADRQPSQPPPLPKQKTLPVVPIANIRQRLFCAVLDFVLVYLVSMFLLVKFLWPWLYPETWSEMTLWIEGKSPVDVLQISSEALSPKAQEGLVFGQLFMTMLLWFYFALCETFTQGSSLGKSVFGLRVMSMRGTRPNPLETCIRASIKALCFLPPVLLVLNLVVLFLNRQRRAAHDIMSSTVVVASDRFPVNQE